MPLYFTVAMKMYTLITNWKKKIKDFTLDELILTGLTISLFISTYFAVAGIIVTAGYILLNHRLKSILAAIKGAYYILAFCALSFLVSLYYNNIAGVFIAAGMTCMFIVAMYMRTVITRDLFELIIDISCALSLFCFAIAALQTVLHWGTSYRAVSTFLNANYYATIIEFVVLFSVYRLLQNPDRKKKLYYGSVIFLNFLGLFLCDCRSAVAVLFVAVAAYLLLHKEKKAFLIFIAVSVLVGAMMFFIPELFPRSEKMGSDLQIRLSIWKTSLKGILANPVFGQGGGAYALTFPRYGGHNAPHAHNIILDLLLNFGIVGVILFLMYFKENIKSLSLLRTRVMDRKRFCLAAAVGITVALHGLTDITVFGVQTGLLLTIVISIAGLYEAKPVPVRSAVLQKAYGNKWYNS